MISIKALTTSLVILVHSWYPQACCGGYDCHPVPCDELLPQKDGGVKWMDENGTTYTWDYRQVQPSQDNKCHVCIVPPYPQENGGMVPARPTCAFTLQSF